MSTTALVANVPSDIPEGELETRVAVAACYRLLVHYRLSDITNGFVAARIPDEPDACLVGRYGDFPEEVTASGLVRMSIHNTSNVVVGEDVAPAAVPLFQSLFQSRPDVYCVIHTHTKATEVLSSLGCELLPMSHPALMLHKRTGYVDYAFYHDEDFCEVMVEAFKENVCLLMRNHGMMAIGHTPGAAFFHTFNFDQACAIQLAAYHSGREICFPRDTDKISELYVSEIKTGYGSDGSLQWEGWLRMLDRQDMSYRT
jgi:ribulose-5-phosphate 4-epimerase/fuculose-1-phosphate aldolase